MYHCGKIAGIGLYRNVYHIYLWFYTKYTVRRGVALCKSSESSGSRNEDSMRIVLYTERT